VPPPLVTVKVTVTPLTGDPFCPRRITDGRSDTIAPAEPVTVVGEFGEIEVAVTGAVESLPHEICNASAVKKAERTTNVARTRI
jgi:hypothetical protein